MPGAATRGRAGSIALRPRLRFLTWVRLVAAALTVVLLATAQVVGAGLGREAFVAASAAYLALNVLVLLLLRALPGAVRVLRDVGIVLDAVWATALLAVVGNPLSPLIVVLYLQLVAATVLFAWQTGVKLALAYTLGLAALVLSGTASVDGSAVLEIAGVPVDLTGRDAGGAADTVVMVRGLLAVATLWAVAVVTAFVSAVNERDLRRSNRELAVLRELNTDLEHSLDLGDVCTAIARGTVEELGYRRAVVWMADDGVLRPGGTAGFSDTERLGSLVLPTGADPVGTAIAERAPQLLSRDDARPDTLAEAFSPDSPLVVVPLVSEGRLLGVLSVEVPVPAARAPRVRGRDLRILETLATESSLALDNARLHAELRDLSVTDALTGVFNHRYFQQRLQEELDRAVRHADDGPPLPVSLILMDIDFFKQVNDRFGHPSGDEVLRSFARLTARVLRSSDVTCRYGGEEFAVILPETDRGQALQVAERLREAVQRSSFTGAGARELGPVTASFGVETFTAGEPSRAGMIQRADEALYAAKEAGRNRVVHAATGGHRDDSLDLSV